MSPGPITRSIGRATTRLPGIRRIPVLKLLAAAEIGLLARDHVMRLSPDERRRMIKLVRTAHGRPANLDQAEREELADLVAKIEPRLLAGEAVGRLSPLPIPRRITTDPATGADRRFAVSLPQSRGDRSARPCGVWVFARRSAPRACR